MHHIICLLKNNQLLTTALLIKSNLLGLAFEYLHEVSPNPIFLLTSFLPPLLLLSYNYLLQSYVLPLIFTQLLVLALC